MATQNNNRDSWGLLAGAIFMSAALSAYELVPASVTPLIRDSMGVSASEAGLLVSVMFGTIVVTSIPVGIMLDRTDTRYAAAAAIVLFIIAGAWGWQAATIGAYWSLVTSRILGGVAFVIIWNAGIDIVGRSFTLSRQGTAVAIFTASGPIGFTIAQVTGPVIADRFGWPVIFPIFVTIACIGLIIFWPMSRRSGHATKYSSPTLLELNSVVTNRRVWNIGLLGFLSYAIYLFVNTWGPSYLTEQLMLPLGLSGAIVALFPAVGVLSRVVGGILSDTLFNGRRRPVILISFLVTAPIVGTFTLIQKIPIIVTVLVIAGFAIQLCLGLVFTYVREVVDADVAATAVAVVTSVGLSGAFVGPIAAGKIIDTFNYEISFLTVGISGLLGLVLTWYAPEPLPDKGPC